MTEKCWQQTLEKGWTFDIFSKFSKIHETYRIYWNHCQEHAYEIWSSLEVSIFDRKTPTAPELRKRMKFWHFLIVLRNSWNLQNLLESPPGTCMWNLKQFGEVSIFDRKMLTAPDLEKGWNFDIFSKFSKIHETYRIIRITSRNMKQFGEVSIFDRKMPTAPDLRKRMKFWHFLKVLRIYETYRIYWNHLKEHACKWSSLEKFQFFTEKCRQRRTLEKGWNFDISSKVSKIHETYRIYWNHYQKHACEIWGSLEKLQC